MWVVLGDLAATHRWIPGVASARMEGLRRICRTQDGFEIVEEISDYSKESRTRGYRQLQVPAPIKNSHGKFAVLAVGDGSVVVWDSEFDPLEPSRESEITGMMSGFYDQTLESLRRCVEG